MGKNYKYNLGSLQYLELRPRVADERSRAESETEPCQQKHQNGECCKNFEQKSCKHFSATIWRHFEICVIGNYLSKMERFAKISNQFFKGKSLCNSAIE